MARGHRIHWRSGAGGPTSFADPMPQTDRTQRVAVIDHDPARLETTARALAQLGCCVIGFGASQLALEQIPSCACAVDVVLDVEGAIVDGGSLGAALRARLGRACPRLVLASSSPDPDRRTAYDAVTAEAIRGPELVAALDCAARGS